MGVRIFRDDHWNRIKAGVICRRDIMGLDPDKDRELIGYLIAHAPESVCRSMMKYAAEKYGMKELPAPPVNIDDPEDTFFWEYLVLREQVMREADRDVLTDIALHGSDYDLAAFAFGRLTGYRFPAGDCDAYSYRTYRCEILPDTDDKSIIAVCRSVIEEKGLLTNAAEQCLMSRNGQNTEEGQHETA